MKSFYKLFTILVVLVFYLFFIVDAKAQKQTLPKLTIISVGSPGGNTFLRSMAFQKDLQNYYDVELLSYQNMCLALRARHNIKNLTLSFYNQEDEVDVRLGKICEGIGYSFKANQIVTSVNIPRLICSEPNSNHASADFIKPGAKYKIGVNPSNDTINIINAINRNAKTTHKLIPYQSTGAVMTALINGEIDYTIVSIDRWEKLRKDGVRCQYITSNTDTYEKDGVSPLQRINEKDKLLTYENIFIGVAEHGDDEQIKVLKSNIQTILKDDTRNITQLWKKANISLSDAFLDNQEVYNRWEEGIAKSIGKK